ncbi:HAMP domain-containing sensor histidine kinase [Neobacillus mesonae]|uniref:HAMP domain-containing sensor histidine kinase n=1 Tax=Neobacillus mesonae TaxID=1193713 RepID=UPI00203E5BB6|nr:HAMP domain-containing sensor histidine kinase [Neobacillus mesonae]MCM3571486.1 HAMP domain-containing histidine kinase [Neobacillus mesonae]
MLESFLKITFQENTQYFDKKGVFIEVLDDKNHPIYSNFTFHYKKRRLELEAPLTQNRHYIIRDINNKTFLFVTNGLKIKDQTFKFTYIRNISSVYQDRKGQYNLFLKLNLIIALLLAVSLYALARFFTYPISILKKSTQTIAGGDFSERVKIESTDEVGMLAENFNQMAEAIEDKIKELEKNAEQKQHFIEAITHEIKTPLTSIIGYADFLRSTKYNEKIFLESLDYIYHEGKRLEALSFKLMDLILLKSKDFQMKQEDMFFLCKEAADVLRHRFEAKNITLSIHLDEAKATVDKDLIKVLLTNLLDNAIKASTEGSTVRLSLKKHKDKIIIRISDQGIGISEEDMERIFDPFFTVDKARTRANGGAGIGLAICAEIVKLHDGEIYVHSEIGKGTDFEITLPLTL